MERPSSAANFLDELAVAPPSVLYRTLQRFGNTLTDRVGSIVEYECFRRNNHPRLPSLAQHSAKPIVQRIVDLLDGRVSAHVNLSLQPIESDAAVIPTKLGRDTAWTAFMKRVEASSRTLGFADSIAAGVAGAIGELADNVIQHSDTPTPGIVAFKGSRNRFEYVIADSGIGMLESLRRAPEFRSLRDDIEALPLAVTPGVSRYGRGVGYGYGYRAVFLPLRAANGYVRLRSGRAVLQVSGFGPRPDHGVCSQRPYHQGVVVSVEISPTDGIGD